MGDRLGATLLSDALDLPRPFGSYTLLRRVAVGGMAEVYVASTKGIGGFEKSVAIKVIHPRFSEDEHFIQMLVEEAKISVQLNHVNVAQTFDLGCVDETYFIAMEFIEGADCFRIEQRAREKGLALPIEICCYLISEVLNGLSYAHRKRDGAGQPLSIVHRDISPQNVLVSHSGEVKLVDFGIAKAALRTGQTEVGVLKGKYYYMSPEQAWADPVDHRTDIFSTGLLLHELLTGEMVYQEDNIPALLDRVRKAEVPPVRSRRTDVPDELEAIVAKALAKEAEDRYQDAQSFSQDLSRFLYSRNPTFTASKLAQLMGTLFEDEVKPHSGAERMSSIDEEAARRTRRESFPEESGEDTLDPMQAGDFGPAAKDSVIFDLGMVDDEAEDRTRNDLPPFRRRGANNETRELVNPSERASPFDVWDPKPNAPSTPDAETPDDWGGPTNVASNDNVMDMARQLLRSKDADPGSAEIEGEATVASASFPSLMDSPVGGAKPRRPPARPSFPRPAPAARPAALQRNSEEAAAGEEEEMLAGERTVAFTPGADLPMPSPHSAPVPAQRIAAPSPQPSPAAPRPSPLPAPRPGPAPFPRPGPAPQSRPSPAPRPRPAGQAASPRMAAAPVPDDPFAPIGGPPQSTAAPVHAEAPNDPFAQPLPAPTAAAAPGVAVDPFAAPPAVPDLPPTPKFGGDRSKVWIPLLLGSFLAAIALVVGLVFLVVGGTPTTLEVSSVPTGARVELDGTPLAGVTPISVEGLTPGANVRLVVRKQGFEPQEAEFDLHEGANRRVVLLNEVRVTLRVETVPPNAQVWVDDTLRGRAPIEVPSLPVGRAVNIRASAPERREVTRRVTLSGEQSEVVVRLELPAER